MKRQKRNEDAASPVIGVMLMLVVTVVIAAVITAFATGMAGDSTSTTPMALLEADNPQLHPTIIDGFSGNKPVLNTFDIVHKGGDSMVLENIQITLEPVGGAQFGIIIVREGDTLNHMKVLGKESQNGEATVSTGDRIRIAVVVEESNSLEYIPSGATVKWTVSDIRTNGIIAKGEFVVPEK
ncbi:MAG TPA: type IV pilin [Methanocorpusculum sp.]|jgi:hypothetical protein|nr:type IV pilin [Methanocorpusculum sp.]HJJ68210.1 type IV pilin [Methanocorpusculum sp.]HJJ71310.1 type IV pilin [Methanocorpusculum sp.]HJJ81095.1 type IV pilin [Methanocorpusculum sp.]